MLYPGHVALPMIAKALGLTGQRLQRVVIEVDIHGTPTVYVKTLPPDFRVVANTLAEMADDIKVVPVADVDVDALGNVNASPAQEAP